MATTVIFEERFEMPLSLHSLADFRRWALSGTCPETGRIDYIGGRIEVDMSPEDLFTHGTLKAEICGVLHGLAKQSQLGHLFTDSTRVSCPEAGWSMREARSCCFKSTGQGRPGMSLSPPMPTDSRTRKSSVAVSDSIAPATRTAIGGSIYWPAECDSPGPIHLTWGTW